MIKNLSVVFANEVKQRRHFGILLQQQITGAIMSNKNVTLCPPYHLALFSQNTSQVLINVIIPACYNQC